MRAPKQSSLKNVFPDVVIEEARKNIALHEEKLKKNMSRAREKKIINGGKSLSPVKKPKIT